MIPLPESNRNTPVPSSAARETRGGLEFGHFRRADLPETAGIGSSGSGSHCGLAGRGNPDWIAITQPRVARNELPWVVVTKVPSTLKGLNPSVGFSQIEAVRKYIAGQQGHDAKVSFQDEFHEPLRRYKLEFDERYVWD
jgi:hypothetical protein